MPGLAIGAVVFDLDGVLIDSEGLWNDTLRELAAECGGSWPDDAKQLLLGTGLREACRYMHVNLGFQLLPADIERELDRRMLACYRQNIPALPGAVQAVLGLHAEGLAVGLASSSTRELIDAALEGLGLASVFTAVVAGGDVARGKPAPDIYLAAARRLGFEPGRCVAVEDSANGLRSAFAGGLRVIAIPQPPFPLPEDALILADVVLPSIERLSVTVVHDMGQLIAG